MTEELHMLSVETIDDEYSVTMQHPMDKGHYTSFIAYTTSNSAEIIKLYPEQDISVRLRKKDMDLFMRIAIDMDCLKNIFDTKS